MSSGWLTQTLEVELDGFAHCLLGARTRAACSDTARKVLSHGFNTACSRVPNGGYLHRVCTVVIEATPNEVARMIKSQSLSLYWTVYSRTDLPSSYRSKNSSN